MPRPRQRSRRNWPDYLNKRNTKRGDYYFWKHPETGQEFGLGYDFQEAAAEAREANLHLAGERTKKLSLKDRIATKAMQHTWGEWLVEFKKKVHQRPGRNGQGLSDVTKRHYDWYIDVIRAAFGADTIITKIDTRQCAELIDGYVDADKRRLGNILRRFIKDCFDEAIAAGWMERGHNPMEITKAPWVGVKRARISEKQFMAILDKARKTGEPWMEIAILLGLLTGLRVGDIATLKFSDVKDGFLHVIPSKGRGRHRLRLSLGLGLPLVGLTIGDVIKNARKGGIVGAGTIVHYSKKIASVDYGDPVTSKQISSAFTDLREAVYDTPAKVRKEWEDKNPPTFHELRALSKSLYKAIGVDTKALHGHIHDATEAIYGDPRGGWVTVMPTQFLAK